MFLAGSDGPASGAGAWWLTWRHIRAVSVLRGADFRCRLAMEFLALPTYRGGVRLPSGTLGAARPLAGLLIIEERRAADGRGVLRVARFRRAAARFPELLLPLFDPVLLCCGRRGALLGGFEMSRADGVPTLQAWWLQPMPGTGGFTPADRPAR